MGIRSQAVRAAVAGVVACLIGGGASAQPYLTVSESEGGGPAPADLVDTISDPTSAYSLAGSITTAVNTPSGAVDSSPRAMGEFQNGTVAPGTYLPTNQPDPQNPTATYTGGIGVASGVCLCTGAASDSDTAASGDPNRGVGAEGPNNGEGMTGANEGEIGIFVVGQSNLPSADFIDRDFDKHVFNETMTTDPELRLSGDPTVVQFQITLLAPGFLRVRCVFGSDEYPHWVAGYNDSFAILIRKDACPNADFENIALFKEPGNPNPTPFSLQAVVACDFPVFRMNQLAPAPSVFVGPPPNSASPHAIDATPGTEPFEYNPLVPHYDHEFGGFTKPLIFETPTALSPGDYTIKLVIHDVGDAHVDSALFIEEGSLKLFELQQGDYNGDGVVDAADYTRWRDNQGKSPATFYDGDGNGDCVVSTADYYLWYGNYGETGNGDFTADFNRDGVVNAADYTIWQMNNPIGACATRFDGDANGDGDVDAGDYTAWRDQLGSGGGGSLLAATEEGAFDDATLADVMAALARREADKLKKAASVVSGVLTKEMLPEDPDLDGDGVLNEEELARLDAIILGEQ